MSRARESGAPPGAEHRFAPTTFLIMGGLLIWTADFAFVYAFAAVACARGFSDVRLAGIGIVPLVTTAATVLAIAATSLLVRYAKGKAKAATGHTRFIYSVAIATSCIAVVALLWLLVPPLAMRACAASL